MSTVWKMPARAQGDIFKFACFVQPAEQIRKMLNLEMT